MLAQKFYLEDGFVFEQYDQDYNLSHNYIHSLLKDSKGFIWLGTPEGVNVLDGKNVKIIKGYLNKNNNFRGKNVLSLFEDSKGNVFCGTKSYGLNIYNRSSGAFTNIKEPLLSNALSKSIKSIVEIDNQNYALLTEKDIIFFTLDSSNNVSYTSHLEITLNDKEYTRELLIYENQLYLVSNKRLLKITEDKQELIFSHKWLNQCSVENNRLWIIADKNVGYFTKSLSRVNWLNYKLKEPKNGDSDYFISLDVSTKNEVWIGTKYQLIQLKLDKSYHIIDSKEIESKIGIKNLFVDTSDNVFIATRGTYGLVKIDGRQHQYNYIKLPEGYEKDYRHNFSTDNNGIIWIGGNKGVFAYNTKSQAYYKFKNGTYKGLPNRKINHQFKDSSGKVWFVTSNGIANYNSNKGSFDIYGQDIGDFWDSFTVYLHEDGRNNLWYKTKDGINKINNLDKSHTFYKIDDLEVIFIDDDNSLWATIKNVGLVKYSIESGTPTLIKNYFTSDEILNYGTQQILDDKYGRLWISSKNGIYIYSPTKEKFIFHINSNNVLNFDFTYGIVEDTRGDFWIKQYNYPAVCVSSDSFEVIDRSPLWMRNESETKIYAAIASFEDNGNVFTDGTGGFFMYHIDSLKTNPRPPHYALEKIEINGETKFDNFLGAKELAFDNLKFNNNNIDIVLKEINPQTTYTTQYAHRLLGSSDEWQITKTLGNLNFSSLNPNNYQLQVKSTNDGEHWSTPLTLATFNILPPWWQTNYAYIVYLLSAALILYTLYKTQLNKRLAITESQNLKQVDDFKNKFYQNITHEFRTPLTVIMGLTNEIKDENAAIIKRNADQLLNLVNELLEIGQIEANESKLNLKIQDIVSYSKYCLESLQSLASEKNIALKFSSNNDVIFTNYDTQKYQLILNNLLSNAIKFTPVNGVIELDIIEQNNIVNVIVKDSGSGIPKKQLSLIFDRYYKSDSELNPYGIGIGLSLTKELVMLMGGTIKVENIKDSGACFTIELPVFDPIDDISLNKNLSPSSSKTLENLNQNLILVIEDNEDVRNYVHSILDKNYKIVLAKDGKEGIEKAQDLIPDIILSDVMMPRMSGYEVCEALKNDHKTNHIPIVLLTAKADFDSKIEGISQGADAYLSKPFNETELLVQLDNLIRTREKLKKKYASEIRSNTNKKVKLTDSFLSKVQNLLLSKIDNEDYGIIEICKDLAISRTQLHRKIKALTGLSTSIFLREIRLNEAYKLISNKDITIAEIAYQTGFSDPNYFSKLFSEKYNLSPTEMRKRELNIF